jgi:hypothetical protein
MKRLGYDGLRIGIVMRGTFYKEESEDVILSNMIERVDSTAKP